MTTRQPRQVSKLSTERERLEMQWSMRDISHPVGQPPVRLPASPSDETVTSGKDDRGAPPARVLVVEDEESFVDALTVNLEREGFFVTVARDVVEALERFAVDQPDLVLLDVMLPRLSGIDVCRAIRANSNVPIIMVTAKSTEIDTVVGLEVGADDYVAKPYRIHELVSRMRAVLRRAPSAHTGTNLRPSPSGAPPNSGAPHNGGADRGEADWVEHAGSSSHLAREATERDGEPTFSTAALRPEEILQVGNVALDLGRHECIVRGEEVKLPLKEFELLEMLLSNPGRVVTRDTLIDRVWGMDYVGDTKTLDVHVKRLRSRIEQDPSKPVLITTIRGLGYRFESPRR